jgi:hypothetical protein
MIRTHVARTCALTFAASLLAACGNEGPAEVSTPTNPTRPTAPAGGGPRTPAVPAAPALGGGGGGLGGAAEKAPEGPPLKLVATVKAATVSRGDPILVHVEVRNVGDAPVGLADAQRELLEGLFVQVSEAMVDGKPQLRGYGMMVRSDPGEKPEVTAVQPGEMIAADVDLQPLLSRSPMYDEDEIEFAVLFRGRGARVVGTVETWNPEGKSALVSEMIQVDLDQPDWMKPGEDDEDGPAGEAWNTAVRYRVGTPGGEKIEKQLAKYDEREFRGLAAVVARLESNDPMRSAVGGNALRLLRAAGARAHAAIAGLDEGSHPGIAMAKAVLADDARSQPSVPKLAAQGVASGSSSAWLRISDASVAGEAPVVYTLTDDRFLMLTEGQGDAATTSARQLAEKEMTELREAVVRSCLWCWKPARTTRREGEGTVVVRFGRGRELLVNLELAGEEGTRDNPLAADLLKALRKARDNDPTRPAKKPSEEK